jgi:predicted Fe-S protein YdhL (DUF1289 family)
MTTRSTDPVSAAEPDAPVESPCIRLCTLDDDDVCLGCYRNITEICAWGSAPESERRGIVRAATARREACQRRA